MGKVRWNCGRCRMAEACMRSVRAGGPFALHLCEAPDGSVIDDGTAQIDRPLGGNTRRVMDIMWGRTNPITTRELVTVTGWSNSYCAHVLRRLIQSGYVERSSERHTGLGRRGGWFHVYRLKADELRD
jgi:hypothetical protein